MKLISKKGFTLIELVAVTAIISFLAYSAVPYGESIYEKQNEDITIISLQKIRNALDNYYKDNGHYPIIPTFTPSTPPQERFNALQTLERELAGKEVKGYPDDIYEAENTQRIYLVEIPPNPFTNKKEDWEIRDSYLPAWHPINEAMNPIVDSVGYGHGSLGSTGTFSGSVDVTDPAYAPAKNLANQLGYPVLVKRTAYSLDEPVKAMNDVDLTNKLNTLKSEGKITNLAYIEGLAFRATGTFYNVENSQKTRDIFDIRFPSYINRMLKTGTNDKDLSEF
ncbi:MAG: type II secretion system GspH family protein [Candidatus Muirbacterium halophilum]|nr:type II secretion system GspH family protein [Candidatus Muirbacterium halophilum]MCK9476982.1 type II secretion system GspH family protein [Candidatus Muirbacterium halophilum]